MRRRPSVTLISVVSSLAMGARFAVAHPPPTTSEPVVASATDCTFALDVHAVDAQSHEAIDFAQVWVEDVYVGDTDLHGHIVVGERCPGTTHVRAERADYQGSTVEVAVASDRSIEVELTALATEIVEIEGDAPPPVALGAATTLSGAALDRTRGKGLAESLAEVPGVTKLSAGTAMSKPVVRGQFGRRLLLLVDGLRHRAQEWGLDHAPEVDPFTADAITVVRGAAGVAYGPDAIGGAVLIAPPPLRRTVGVGADLHLVGSGNALGSTVASRVQWVPRAAPRLSLQLEGTAARMAAAWAPDYPLDNTGSRQWTVGTTVGYRRGHVDLTASYRRFDAELGVCSCLRLESSEDFYAQLHRASPIGAESYRDDAEIERPSQAVVHDTAIARGVWRLDAGTVTAQYGFQHDRRREYDVVRNATVGPQFDFRLFTHDLAATFEHRLWHLTDHLHLRGSVGAVGVVQDHAYGGLPLVPSYQASGVGVFAIERLLGTHFELEAGVRYDRLARTAQLERIDYLRLVRSGQLAMDACAGGVGDPLPCGSTFQTVSASLGGLYQVTPEGALKLELATASRPPTTDEQYLNGTAPSFPVLALGKPDLGVETTYSSTVTATYQGPRVALEASGYANFIADYIAFAPAIGADGQPIFDVLIRGTFPRFVTRAVDAIFYGGDAGVVVRPTDWLELAGQVAVVRARDRSNDRYLPLIPADRVHVAATARRARIDGLRDLYATVDATAVAHQDRFDAVGELAAPPAGYLTVGGELGATFPTSRAPIRLALSGANLTSTRYREYTSLSRYFVDQPGWQLLLRLSLHLDSTRDDS